MITTDEIENYFTHHPPTPAQVAQYEVIREAGKAFADCVRVYTPPSADQSAAIRKIREAVMTANAAIACDTGRDTKL